jgi:hypothetical protein
MGLTPDRAPGPSEEEELQLEDQGVGVTPSVVGAIIQADGVVLIRDAVGTFDARGGTGITEAQHRALRQLIHFVDDGPAEGFASGAHRETLPTGPFPTSMIWWESSGKAKRIVSLEVTYTGAFPTTEVWKVYDVDGSTVLATVTDAIVYTGAFETSRTRVIA